VGAIGGVELAEVIFQVPANVLTESGIEVSGGGANNDLFDTKKTRYSRQRNDSF